MGKMVPPTRPLEATRTRRRWGLLSKQSASRVLQLGGDGICRLGGATRLAKLDSVGIIFWCGFKAAKYLLTSLSFLGVFAAGDVEN